jgi:nucleoside-diphosphate-sugar epimerase
MSGKVLVTGGDGQIGRVVVQDLRNKGYEVTPVDKYPKQKWGTRIVDCEDLGQVIGVMKDHDAVIHMAAIPSPLSHPADVVFRTNVISTYNILEAAAILGIQKVVLASSISALGFAFRFRHINPQQVPIDEEHPLLSQDAYGLSKMVGEEVADGYSRRIPDISLSSLRFSFIINEENRETWIKSHGNQEDLCDAMANILWTYTDVRDAAAACRLAMEAGLRGHEAYFIAAPKILVEKPVEELLAKYYPGNYPVAAHISGSASPVDCAKAERILGWKSVYDWEGNVL